MSEDRKPDESGETGEQDSSINRRRFVQSLGVAGGAAAFGMAGIGNADAEGNSAADKGPNVTNVTALDNTPTSTVQSAMDQSENEALKQHFKEEHDLAPNYADVVGVAIETDSKQWNADDPTAVMVPFGPTDVSQGKAGLLNILTVEHQGETLPIASIGFTVTPATSTTGVSADAAGAGVVTTYGTGKDGDPLKLDQSVQSGESATSSGDVHATASLGCTACTEIVSRLCEGGAGDIGVEACFAICLETIETGIGYLVCDAACGIIVEEIASIGCNHTSNYICNQLNFC